MNEKIDVAVVGGGPCGSLAAFTASKLGAEVVVCEEHREVGVPTHCPGHISIGGLKLLGLQLPQKVVENEIRGAVFYSASDKKLTIECASPVTLVVKRELFDKHISDIAMKAGVRYLFRAKAESLLFNSGFGTGVVLRRKGVRETLTSKIVIDAEGCSSVLLKRAGLRTLDTSMAVKGIHAEVDSVEEVSVDTVEVYLGRKYAPGLFAWIIPKKDGSAKVGLATSIGNPREYLRRFMSEHPIASRKLKKSKIIKLSFHPISLGGAIPKTYSNRLLIVGDAASQVKSTTGGGIVFGLLCSKIAGEVAYESLQKCDFREWFMSKYQTRWTRLIGFDLTAMLQLRKMLNRIPDDKMDNIVNLCSRLEVDKILGEVRNFDFEGRSLIRMIRHPEILIVAFYSIFSSIVGKPLFLDCRDQPQS